MDSDYKFSAMEINTKANTLMANSMERANTFGRMDQLMKVDSIMACETDMGNGKMDQVNHTLANTLKIKSKATGNMFGRTDAYIKALSTTI